MYAYQTFSVVHKTGYFIHAQAVKKLHIYEHTST